MNENYTLIVPIAADKPEYDTHIPYVFRMDDDGVMLCLKAILGLDLSQFSNIVITILRKHDNQYGISKMLNVQIERLGLQSVEICLLDNPTKNQAETIYQTICQKHIDGAIYVKDADGYFESEVVCQNGVAIYPIEKLQMLNPQNKSFVNVDDLFRVTNIIEKHVVSHFINAGGYCFECASQYCQTFKQLEKLNEKLYLSHIVYAMLLDGIEFRPTIVTNFEDWGDTMLYTMHKNKQS